MASPILSQRTYRLSHIPDGTTTDEIRHIFPSDVRQTIQYLSLANSLDWTQPHSLVSTVTFETEPSALASLPYKHGYLLSAFICDIDDKFSRVWIDAHFHGFTVMNNPACENDVVDIIALTGLGGKAFASWQCYDGSMWLRDHIPLDIPNSRISIYGYSSEVANNDSVSTLSEITEIFILDLLNYRRLGLGSNLNKRSPLILMGHSTGGLIVKDAWCRAAESASPSLVDIYRSIFGLVFFGTPHNGMVVSNILPGLTGQPSEHLIRDIEPGSTYIKTLKERFSRATTGLNIISCYELRCTPQSEFRPDGSLVRSGKSAMNSPESTACLYWANEVRLPINENHSMIGKLAKRDGSAYHTVVNSLLRLVIASRVGVSMRYLPHTTMNSVYQVSKFENLTANSGIITPSGAIESEQRSHPEEPITYQTSNAKNVCSSSMAMNPPARLVSPIGFEVNEPPFGREVRVYVSGSWDMFHYGHVRFLASAKRAIPNTYLLVGVTGDKGMESASSSPVMSGVERAEVVRSCKYVNKVIENCPAVLLPEFVAQYHIDYVGCSEESLSGTSSDIYKFLKMEGKVFVIPRSNTITSTDIKTRIIRNRDLFAQGDRQPNVMQPQTNH